MRETIRAKAAFYDYFYMGPKRSLRKLWKIYQDHPSPPTRRLSTLEEWSSAHNWQFRVRKLHYELFVKPDKT